GTDLPGRNPRLSHRKALARSLPRHRRLPGQAPVIPIIYPRTPLTPAWGKSPTCPPCRAAARSRIAALSRIPAPRHSPLPPRHQPLPAPLRHRGLITPLRPPKLLTLPKPLEKSDRQPRQVRRPQRRSLAIGGPHNPLPQNIRLKLHQEIIG